MHERTTSGIRNPSVGQNLLVISEETDEEQDYQNIQTTGTENPEYPDFRDFSSFFPLISWQSWQKLPLVPISWLHPDNPDKWTPWYTMHNWPEQGQCPQVTRGTFWSTRKYSGQRPCFFPHPHFWSSFLPGFSHKHLFTVELPPREREYNLTPLLLSLVYITCFHFSAFLFSCQFYFPCLVSL